MRQIDQTLEERTQTRIERERVANNFRRWVKREALRSKMKDKFL